MKRLYQGLLLVVVVSALSAAAANTELTFVKTAVSDGVWVGSVSGDVSGRLVTLELTSERSQGGWDVEHVVVVIADDPAESFVARLSGTVDTVSGTERLAGDVREGFMSGARVEEAGQVVDAAAPSYAGTLRLVLTRAAPEASADAYYGYPWFEPSPFAAAAQATPPAGAYPYSAYPWDDAPHKQPAADATGAPADTHSPEACGEGGSMDGYPWDDASLCTARGRR